LSAMHELSLLQNVRDILEAEALKQGFCKVRQVTLEIGELACIEAEALRFGFDVVMKDSLAADAELVIEHLAARGRCRHCHQDMAMDGLQQICQFCGQYGVDILQGDTMKIKELRVI